MMRRHILFALAALALAFAGFSDKSANAHTKVSKSIPEDGAVVAPELSNIELHFAGKMRLTVFKITNAGSGEAVEPSTALPPKFVSHVNMEVPPLMAGSYNVKWVGVGSDGHVMQGEFNFSVAKK